MIILQGPYHSRQAVSCFNVSFVSAVRQRMSYHYKCHIMRTLSVFLFSFFCLFFTTVTNRVQAQPGFSDDASFSNFYNELSPYGRWVGLPRYGRVWIYDEPGFRPYSTNGQWENTDLGWSWASGYEWGTIPFHYGRWELDPYYGWFWIPGYDYAPAWVVWSQADDYYGWAPLGFGLDINISLGRIPSNRWMYASAGNILRPRIDRYCIPHERNRFYYGRQQAVVNIYTQGNVRYMGGPHRNGRFDNRNRSYENNHHPAQRPSLRNGQYGNNSTYNGRARNANPENNDRTPGTSYRYDPAQRDRNRDIAERPQAGGRPPNQISESRPPARPAESRPLPSRTLNNRQQERINQHPTPPQAQRPSGNEEGTGSRPLKNKDRRIF